MVKFRKGLLALAEDLHVIEPDTTFVPRPWQQTIIDLVSHPCTDDRKIHWVYDRSGNIGKSRLALHLIRNYGATLLTGKLADMAYAYNREPIVIFDLSRKQVDMSDHLYTFTEWLKNGVYMSTKYESKMKTFVSPHVIFFANSRPDDTAWTPDRYVIHIPFPLRSV